MELRDFTNSTASEKLATLKAYKCYNCNRLFSAQVQGNVVVGRLPYLMPCSHAICFDCISQMISKNNSVNCKLCQCDMKLENSTNLKKHFPIERYMFGALLTANTLTDQIKGPTRHPMKVLPSAVSISLAGMPPKPVKSFKKKDGYFRTSVWNNQGNSSSSGILENSNSQEGATRDEGSKTAKQKCCQEDCNKEAEVKCSNCFNEVYCKKCDKRIHNSIRILKNHVRYPVDAADLTDFNVKCSEHVDNISEYFCITCENMFCSKCVIKDHTGHDVISIEDKNNQEMPAFKETLQKARFVLNYMESTKKKINTEISNEQQNLKPSQTEYEITKHFARLHSHLQLLENSMLQEYHRAQAAQIIALNELSKELQSNIDILSPLVSIAAAVTNIDEYLSTIMLSKIHEKLTMNLNLPCILDEDYKENETNNEPAFFIDDSILEALETHCRIEGESYNYILSSITDFADLNSTEADSTISSVQSRSELDSSSSESLVQSVNSLQPIHSHHQNQPPQEMIYLKEDTMEHICVTHITNPSSFYVQISRQKKEILSLNVKYASYAQHAKMPSDIEEGELYIVQYSEGKDTKLNGKWYRGRIIKSITVGVMQLYEVFFIDYGNTSLVPLSKIREMKSIFRQDPPFAHKCRLAGIISQKDEWCDEVIKYMVQYVTGKSDLVDTTDPEEIETLLADCSNMPELRMRIVRNDKSILDVQLYTNSSSLHESLMFMGLAKLDPLQEVISRKLLKVPEKKIVSAISNFEKDRKYQVIIPHIINPHDMYVQLATNKKVIINLEVALSRQFQKIDLRQSIFQPEVGMFCSVNVNNTDNTWQRGKIINVIGNGHVEVYLLDHGGTYIVNWEQVRKLKEQYRTTDAQAINVAMADVELKQEYNGVWPEKVVSFLKQHLSDKELSINVNQTAKEKLTVTIYELTEAVDICINAVLVKKDLANSTGVSSQTVEFHKMIHSEKNITNVQNVEELIEQVQSLDNRSQETICPEKYFAAVKVLHIESPSCFYVSWTKWTEERLKFIKNMATFYSEQISPEKTWEINSICVVQSNVDKLYYRCSIKNILPDNLYEVFMKDIVRTEVVPSTSMFELYGQFGLHDFSLRCKLADLKPPCGVETWPQTSTEYFKEFVQKYPNLYITKLNVITDKTVPVHLVAMWEENNGPLKPTSTQIIILNETLLNIGLALPDKINESVKKYDYSNLIETSFGKLKIKSPKSSKAPSKAHSYNIPNNSASIPITRWLEPQQFEKKCFKAWPTYVDHDGYVYIQTLKSKAILSNMRRVLDTHFKNVNNNSASHQWNIGDLCTVQYHLDQSFCRGIITDITEDKKINVQLVDFGNIEECTPEELRTEILMTDIPILAVKCALLNVVPKTKDGKWPITILDTLHLTIVEKECDVYLETENNNKDIPHIKITLNNICVNTTIMNWDWEKNKSKAEVNKSQSDDDSVLIECDNLETDDDVVIEAEIYENIPVALENKLKYQYAKVPNDLITFEAVVVNFINYRSMLIESSFIMDHILETKKQFEELCENVHTIAPTLPRIVNPEVGTPCTALFGVDGRWYRAEILSIDKTGYEIKVLFVDYGNIEIVPLHDVKPIKPEWLEYPVQLIKCKIWGIRKAPGIDTDDILLEIKDLMIEKCFTCQVKEYNPENSKLEIKLFNRESYELAYKKLLDDQYIVECGT